MYFERRCSYLLELNPKFVKDSNIINKAAAF